MKKRSTKEIKLQAKKALQGHVGTVILGLLAVYGLNTLGTILSTNLFSGTSALDLVLSEVFMLVVSLIVGIISAGLGYMLLNISRGKEFSLGDLGYFFKNQPDRVIVAGFVLALIQLVTAIPYYYVSFTTDPSYDPGNRYSCPYFWGTVGILYDTTVVDPADLQEGWDLLRDTKYKGNIYMYDSERDSFMIALKALGYSMNTTDENQIQEAYQWLVDQRNTMDPIYAAELPFMEFIPLRK